MHVFGNKEIFKWRLWKLNYWPYEDGACQNKRWNRNTRNEKRFFQVKPVHHIHQMEGRHILKNVLLCILSATHFMFILCTIHPTLYSMSWNYVNQLYIYDISMHFRNCIWNFIVLSRLKQNFSRPFLPA